MFSHKQIYGKLSAEFDDAQSRVMSEILIELADHQDAKFTENLDRIVSRMATKEDLARMATKEDLHRAIQALTQSFYKEINAQTWRFVTAMLACMSLMTGVVYFLVQHTT